MKQKITLSALASFSLTRSFAEGQDGLESFILLTYIAAIMFYTIIGGLVFKFAFTILKSKTPDSNWVYFITAFFISLILAFIIGDNFIPFFWFEN